MAVAFPGAVPASDLDALGDQLAQDMLESLFYFQGKFRDVASNHDYYLALAYAIRQRILQRWTCTAKTYLSQSSRTVAYLSAEYLLGPQLGNNLVNLGLTEAARRATESLGLDLETLLAEEEEPGLGNGGLGRLAACYMDSLATLELPAIGYGIRYEFGIFDQLLRDGWQIERTDKWLRYGNPWELPRPDVHYEVGFGGHTEHLRDEDGEFWVCWRPAQVVKGIAFDMPLVGYRVNTANLLRLWKSEAVESFDFQAFNVGDYYGAVEEKVVSENLTKVLYPNDEPAEGKALRLRQQYFFVSCSLQDMIRIHLQKSPTLDDFSEKFTVALNDTHPAIAVAELMRLLVDRYKVAWNRAWEITRRTFAYTNHTLLPEALEAWSLPLFRSVLPRHLEIIFEINQRFLDEVRVRYPSDPARVARLSIIDESGERRVRMANLACIGSYAVNGVAELHTELLKRYVLKDFYGLWPDRFHNVTNGVTPRRFMVLANPGLATLITEALGGDDWVRDTELLRGLEAFVDDAGFCEQWRRVKRANKAKLAVNIAEHTQSKIDPDSLFDVQVKRIHEYKRLHLNLLHVVTLYHRLKTGVVSSIQPRTFIFAGKAAPGYYMAKLMIKLATSVAEVINGDPEINGFLRVMFLPNYNVRTASCVYPAADLSEQISLAGKEASGTGNMKLSLNGALTIGTLDGANIEIRDAVGGDNFFLFGLTEEEVRAQRTAGYHPWEHFDSDAELQAVLDLISSGLFSHGNGELFKPLVDGLLTEDPYMVLADYRSYVDCQDEVSACYADTERWTRMAITNVARMARFSSDRAIRQYASEIWGLSSVHVAAREHGSVHLVDC